ncbi:hypothetical protein FE784_02880 [Paenibacillus hemerocallicola]|uniref:Uncharacterized protein n=1 Tax=Paenibacillus hemerocallicola TaxID=1172614 RepID=A0A5C4TGW3_9BACL|nr:hypothetical protein [Paenibacillus hemerocallicola]TNJ67720.1 hypothetical protein FE784_02880 [Paenibacillus hemerocallicola]
MNRLLDVEAMLKATQTRTHIVYSFSVSEMCRRLHIDFRYSPKTLDDEALAMDIVRQSVHKYGARSEQSIADGLKKWLPLKNLITVSVDDPSGFRGACHRQHAEQHLFLAADSASPGLMPGPLQVGNWSITLSVHALVTDLCSYRLTVREEKEW